MKVLKKAKIVSSATDTAHIKSERNILGSVRKCQMHNYSVQQFIRPYCQNEFCDYFSHLTNTLILNL